MKKEDWLSKSVIWYERFAKLKHVIFPDIIRMAKHFGLTLNLNDSATISLITEEGLLKKCIRSFVKKQRDELVKRPTGRFHLFSPSGMPW
ncbi:MAG: hypothetical protein Phog2KO_44160 [Phototrophicaceae bacterium]